MSLSWWNKVFLAVDVYCTVIFGECVEMSVIVADYSEMSVADCTLIVVKCPVTAVVVAEAVVVIAEAVN